MESYQPEEYWRRVALSSAGWLSAVIHPLAPEWLNVGTDRCQARAWRRAVLPWNGRKARALDIGCGTGRWLERLQARGFEAVGVDLTPNMLALARRRGCQGLLVAGQSQCLPFPDASFDLVSVVTVLQHIPPSQQREAVREAVRVLRTGGHLIALELIRGTGGHIFSKTPEEWIAAFRDAGASLVRWFGQEYMLLDRAFVHLGGKVRSALQKRRKQAELSLPGETGLPAPLKRSYWRVRRLTFALSIAVEPLLEAVCPAQLANHGVFVFVKGRA